MSQILKWIAKNICRQQPLEKLLRNGFSLSWRPPCVPSFTVTACISCCGIYPDSGEKKLTDRKYSHLRGSLAEDHKIYPVGTNKSYCAVIYLKHLYLQSLIKKVFKTTYMRVDVNEKSTFLRLAFVRKQKNSYFWKHVWSWWSRLIMRDSVAQWLKMLCLLQAGSSRLLWCRMEWAHVRRPTSCQPRASR